MSARRLHAACPECGRVNPLRPDGTLTRHKQSAFYLRAMVPCGGTGKPPTAEAVAAWLTQHEAEGAALVQARERTVARAREELAADEAALAAAQQEHAERAAWCARQRGRL